MRKQSIRPAVWIGKSKGGGAVPAAVIQDDRTTHLSFIDLFTDIGILFPGLQKIQ